jgi:hypothetical protein
LILCSAGTALHKIKDVLGYGLDSATHHAPDRAYSRKQASVASRLGIQWHRSLMASKFCGVDEFFEKVA